MNSSLYYIKSRGTCYHVPHVPFIEAAVQRCSIAWIFCRSLMKSFGSVLGRYNMLMFERFVLRDQRTVLSYVLRDYFCGTFLQNISMYISWLNCILAFIWDMKYVLFHVCLQFRFLQQNFRRLWYVLGPDTTDSSRR